VGLGWNGGWAQPLPSDDFTGDAPQRRQSTAAANGRPGKGLPLRAFGNGGEKKQKKRGGPKGRGGPARAGVGVSWAGQGVCREGGVSKMGNGFGGPSEGDAHTGGMAGC